MQNVSLLLFTFLFLTIESGLFVEKPFGTEKQDSKSPVEAYRAVVKSKNKAIYSRAALELRKWMIKNDPHYPIYHFTGPESWINDPNGVIFHKGQYHLFYQYDPIVDGERSKRCWGHAVSNDLVHWEDWPIALWPDTEYDSLGVYSGNMVIDDNGIPTVLYTGSAAPGVTYGLMARSYDDLLTWEKNMVMDDKQRPNKSSPVHWDAQIWKDDNSWFQLIGGTENNKGAAHIWSSPDLENWTYCKTIYSQDYGDYWELPYLVDFDKKYALFIGCKYNPDFFNPYWLGEYDKNSLTFTPDNKQPQSADNGIFYSFNLHMTDNKGPAGKKRQLMHGWITGPESPNKTVPYWQGAHSIPRVLTLKGDRLWQEPIPEIQSLRGRYYDIKDLSKKNMLNGIKGDALELKMTFAPGTAKRFGIKLRVSDDKKSYACVYFDAKSGTFGIDGNVLKAQPQKSYLKTGENVSMHIFLDRSIIEVYINGNVQTTRTFPAPDARGLEMFVENGSAELKNLEIWEMKSMWER